jgi:capsid protein
MNLFDLSHSLLTGKWKLDREIVRDQRERYYAGARRSINRPFPAPLSGTEDYKKASERIVLIRAAREMEEDGGFFDGILDDFETYVIGDQLCYTPNTGNPDADRVIRDYLEWQFDQADYSERHDLTKLAQLAERTFKRDGECGFVPVDVGDAIKLHSYESDCIGNPTMASSTQPFDYNGIVVNEHTNAPVKYNLFKRTPKTYQYLFDRAIKAHEFWHIFDPFRLHQFHGVSAFKNSVRDAYDIDQILEFTKLNIKWRSSQLPTVQTPGGVVKESAIRTYGFGEGATVQQGGDGTAAVRGMTVDIGGVSTQYLDTADKVVEYPNDFPNAQLHVTLEEFRRQCCKGVKLPYEFVYRADNGGVVQRFWVDKAKNTFDRDKHLIRRLLLNPYKNRVIQKGIDTGELDLSKFGDLDVSLMRYRGSWQMGKEVSADYGKDNQTDIALIDAGLMSQRDKTASMNLDLDKINDEKDAQARKTFSMAQKLAADFQVDIREALPFYEKKFPNQAAVQQQQTEDPNAAAIEKVQDATKELAEELRADRRDRMILEATRKPSAPPERAINVHNHIPGTTVNMPAQPAPVVTVQPAAVRVVNHHHMQAAAAPSVTVQPAQVTLPSVIVNVPEQPVPVVNVTNEIPPLTATLKIDRGPDGKMTGGKITE